MDNISKIIKLFEFLTFPVSTQLCSGYFKTDNR